MNVRKQLKRMYRWWRITISNHSSVRFMRLACEPRQWLSQRPEQSLWFQADTSWLFLSHGLAKKRENWIKSFATAFYGVEGSNVIRLRIAQPDDWFELSQVKLKDFYFNFLYIVITFCESSALANGRLPFLSANVLTWISDFFSYPNTVPPNCCVNRLVLVERMPLNPFRAANLTISVSMKAITAMLSWGFKSSNEAMTCARKNLKFLFGFRSSLWM